MPKSPVRNPAEGTLRRAVQKGDFAKVKRLLDSGVSVESVDNYGLSALIWAARKGHARICDLLDQRGADIRYVGRDGRGPLHHAAAFNRADAIKTLISLKAVLEAKDQHGYTAYDLASDMNHLESCRVLLDAGARGSPPDSGSFSIGSIQGLDTSPQVKRAIDGLSKGVDRLRSPNPWHERGHLNLGVFVEGAIWSPDHFGVQRARFSKKEKYAVVSVGIRDEHNTRKALEAIIPAMAEAWLMATPWFRKHQIPFDAANVRSAIETIAKRNRMHHVLAMLREDQ